MLPEADDGRHQVRKQSDIESQIDQWDPSVYAIDDGDLDERCAALLGRCQTFADSYQSALYSRPPAEIAAALRELGELRSLALYLDGTTAAGTAIASGDATATDHRVRVEAFLDDMDELVQFAELEWLEVPDSSVTELLADPALLEYRHFLEVVRSAEG